MSERDGDRDGASDILCVPTYRVRRVLSGNGVATNGDYFGWLLRMFVRHTTYRPRSAELEADESIKQFATYTVLRHHHLSGPHVWVYRRIGGLGEGRLAERWSVGVGGHVERRDKCDDRPPPGNLTMTLYAGAMRELGEEVAIVTDDRDLNPIKGIGGHFFLNDESDAVGRVHLGFGAVMDLIGPPRIVPREPDRIAEVGWVSLAKLADPNGPEWGRLESWSKLVVDAIAAGRLG